MKSIGEKAIEAILNLKTEEEFKELLKVAKRIDGMLPTVLSSYVNDEAAHALSKIDYGTYARYKKLVVDYVNETVGWGFWSIRFRFLVRSRKKVSKS